MYAKVVKQAEKLLREKKNTCKKQIKVPALDSMAVGEEKETKNVLVYLFIHHTTLGE